jgi:hypothetical protein
VLNQGEIDVIVAGMAMMPKRALRLDSTAPCSPSGMPLTTICRKRR